MRGVEGGASGLSVRRLADKYRDAYAGDVYSNLGVERGIVTDQAETIGEQKIVQGIG